ncbi:SpoIIE family protein phosphatase [Streptomyces sp. NPDC101151]|uniref:SpoIIE family protein phosphatase n=1 Tax=Streptomyces sp. NPDC101151 TaxID=3366115 RepID=UPI003806366B
MALPEAEIAERVRREEFFTAVLRKAVGDFGVAAATLYMPDDNTLRAVAIGGVPPIVCCQHDLVGMGEPFASATAYRERRLVTVGRPGGPGDTEVPFRGTLGYPYSAAAVPLIHGDRSIGVLVLVWVPAADQPLPRTQREGLTAWGRELGDSLTELEETGHGSLLTARPVLVPVFSTEAFGNRAGSRPWGLPQVPGSPSLTFMFHLHKLATRLNSATSVADVVAAARSWIMLPFNAQAIVVTAIDDGRSWIMGHSGFPRATVRRMHGDRIDGHRPETAVLINRAPLFFETPHDLESRYPGTAEEELRSWAFLPISASGQLAGGCVLGFEHHHRFTPEEQTLVMMMTDLLGSALARARMAEQAHLLAESLQKKLLPRILPEVPAVLTTARYLPARTSAGLGGDWYDEITLRDGRIVLVVGDVEGHSIDSSVVMGQLRSTVRAYATEGHSPGNVLARTNEFLARGDSELIATCCLVCLDVASGEAELASAGHPAPWLLLPDGQVVPVGMPANLPLGVRPEIGYRTTDLVLKPATVLMLYTDGLAEGWPSDVVELAGDLLRGVGDRPQVSPEELADRMVAEILESEQRRDDVALLLARYEGSQLGPRRHVGTMAIERHDLKGVKQARRFIREQLHVWDLDEVRDDVELLASEVVTNALIHADSSVDVRLREYPDHLRLEVRDADPTPPVPSAVTATDEANAWAEHGRGLLIVDELASQWGKSPSGRGKTVWFDMPRTPRTGDGAWGAIVDELAM